MEKATNPFLRYREPEILDRLQNEARIADRELIGAFAALRQWKNTFR
jgi:hydroxyacylglutathione hydrolase